MSTVIAFLIGAMIGVMVGFLLGAVLITDNEDRTVYIPRGVNPDALIAWIENHHDNYEYIAPPTSGEIIKKIKEMEFETETWN